MQNDERPFAGAFESECPHCGKNNVTDTTTFGDDHRRNLCLECGEEYEYTEREDVETRSASNR